MSDYESFYLNSHSSVVQLDTLEISHPSFTKTYFLVRNATLGITVELETGVTQTFDYYPLKISNIGTRDNLDFGLRIDLGDLGTILPLELDKVAGENTYHVNPTVIYRTYRSDDLTKPLFGPIRLEISTFNFNREGASFEAKAPSLNVNKTGETYQIDTIPMLRAFL